MKHSFKIFLIILLGISFFSCSNNNDKQMNFFTLQTTSFVDQITIEGSVEAKNSSSVVCPSRIDGIVLFIIEDGTQVKEGDTVCIVENREIINYYELLVDKVEQSTAQYSKGKADLDMAYALLMAQVESNEAQTAIANLDSLQLQYLPEYQRKIKSLQLEIANVEKQICVTATSPF